MESHVGEARVPAQHLEEYKLFFAAYTVFKVVVVVALQWPVLLFIASLGQAANLFSMNGLGLRSKTTQEFFGMHSLLSFCLQFFYQEVTVCTSKF